MFNDVKFKFSTSKNLWKIFGCRKTSKFSVLFQFLLRFHKVTLAWRNFSVCYFRYQWRYLSFLLAVWWGLGIRCLGFCDISDTNPANGDHSVTDGTRMFVIWLRGGGVTTVLLLLMIYQEIS